MVLYFVVSMINQLMFTQVTIISIFFGFFLYNKNNTVQINPLAATSKKKGGLFIVSWNLLCNS